MADVPTAELENLLRVKLGEFSDLLSPPTAASAAPGAPPVGTPPAPAALEAPPTPGALNLPPDVVRAATAQLVTGGYLQTASDQWTPEVDAAMKLAMKNGTGGLLGDNVPTQTYSEIIHAFAAGRLPVPPAQPDFHGGPPAGG